MDAAFDSATDAPRPDGPVDAALPDAPAADALVSDVAAPDLPAPDVAAPDLPAPDLPAPDLPQLDLPKPDLPVPDAPAPDLYPPDLPAPDKGCASAAQCNDGLTCTTDTCLGTKDACTNILKAGHCLINHRIRVIAGGKVSTLAGTTKGFSNGKATTVAQFDSPQGVVVDKNGMVYVADTLNNRIRVIRP